MTWHTLPAFSLLFQLFHPLAHSRSIPPEHDILGKRDLQIHPVGLPATAPPLPWNQHICRNPLVDPSFYLTYTLGVLLPNRPNITFALTSAKHELQSLIDHGYGNLPLPGGADDFILTDVNVRNRGVEIVADRARAGTHGVQILTVEQTLRAVGLLGSCGVEVGEEREIWAAVWKARRKVGYVYMERLEGWEGVGSVE